MAGFQAIFDSCSIWQYARLPNQRHCSTSAVCIGTLQNGPKNKKRRGGTSPLGALRVRVVNFICAGGSRLFAIGSPLSSPHGCGPHSPGVWPTISAGASARRGLSSLVLLQPPGRYHSNLFTQAFNDAGWTMDGSVSRGGQFLLESQPITLGT